MHYVVEPMVLGDVDEVIEVEKEAFQQSWSAAAYRRELLENRIARYIVLRELPDDAGEQTPESPSTGETAAPASPRSGLHRLTDGLRRLVGGAPEPTSPKRGRIVGYAGMWLMVDEAHLTTIAVRREYQGRGFGEVILIQMVELAKHLRASLMTLEVRASNSVAQALYRKYGFEVVGVRRRYYTDNNEDALIMTTSDLTSPEFEAKFKEFKAANANRTGVS